MDPYLAVRLLFRRTRGLPRYIGSIDKVETDRIVGWAIDLEVKNRPVVIECCRDERVVASAVANAFRDDLRVAGVGDGGCGFTCELPDDVTDLPDVTIRVRVKDSNTFLPHEGAVVLRIPTQPFLWFISADIVNNCNLRCPFCLVDYSAVTHTELMSEETFGNLIRLARSVPDGHFYLSCLHEPTLHPHLNRFLGLIQDEDRRKMFFTTNLAKPLKHADFDAWAHSGLHHINISLDTLDADRFRVLRKFGRFEVFQKNLDELTDVFRQTPGAPPIRYITMVFKSNFDEIAEIVRQSRERWLASENEMRYTYNVAHITDEFRRREYLHKKDWAVLTERLQQTGYPVSISYPPETGYEEQIEPSQNFDGASQPTGDPARLRLTKPMGLRARPDGTILVNGAEDAFKININSVENPMRFFRALLRQATLRLDADLALP